MKHTLRCIALACAWLASVATAAPFAYVANERSGNNTVIDTANDAVVGEFAAGKRPRGLAASKDGKLLYVSDQPANSLQIVDIAARKVGRRIDLGESPEGVYRSPDGKLLAVAVEEDNSVHFIDTASGKRAFQVKTEGENPEHAVFSRDGKWVYVSAEESEVVDVIDVAARKVHTTIKVGKRPRGIHPTASSLTWLANSPIVCMPSTWRATKCWR